MNWINCALFICCLTIGLSLACRPDGDNYCKSHAECCSRFCSIKGNSEYGFCTQNTFTYGNPYGSPYAFGNQNSNQYPYNNPYNNPYNTMMNCKAIWDKTCQNNYECCSGFCHKNHPSWLYGVCMQMSNYQFNSGGYNTPYMGMGGNWNSRICKQNWDNTCQFHQDCCSNYCDTNSGSRRFGTCMPSSYGQNYYRPYNKNK